MKKIINPCYIDETSMIEFLGVLPCQSSPEDGFWCFEIPGTSYIIQLSYNFFEASVQTIIKIDNINVETVSCEGLISTIIFNNDGQEIIQFNFKSDNSNTFMVLKLKPTPSIKWWSLKEP